jgi:hypothetical protein
LPAGRSAPAIHHIVADLSVSHGQDLGMARRLVREAAAASADAIKLRTHTSDTIAFDERGLPSGSSTARPAKAVNCGPSRQPRRRGIGISSLRAHVTSACPFSTPADATPSSF